MAVIGPKNPNFDDKKKMNTASFLGPQMTLESPTAVRVGGTFFLLYSVTIRNHGK